MAPSYRLQILWLGIFRGIRFTECIDSGDTFCLLQRHCTLSTLDEEHQELNGDRYARNKMHLAEKASNETMMQRLTTVAFAVVPWQNEMQTTTRLSFVDGQAARRAEQNVSVSGLVQKVVLPLGECFHSMFAVLKGNHMALFKRTELHSGSQHRWEFIKTIGMMMFLSLSFYMVGILCQYFVSSGKGIPAGDDSRRESSRLPPEAGDLPSSRVDDTIGGHLPTADASLANDMMWFFQGAFASFAYTCVIPSAYDLTLHLGAGSAAAPVLSGWIISVTPLGDALGLLAVRAICYYEWAIHYRPWIVIIALCMGIAAVGYWMCCFPWMSPWLLLCNRAVQGFAAGFWSFLLKDLQWKVLLPEQRQRAQHMGNLGLAFGFAMGPLLAASVESVLTTWGYDRFLVLSASGSMVVVAVSFPLAFFMQRMIPPNLSTASPTRGSDANLCGTPDAVLQKPGPTERARLARIRSLVGGFVVTFWGHFTCQAMEVGTSFLFETHFGWNTKNIGIVVGIAMLVGLPVAAFSGAWAGAPGDIPTKLQRVQWLLVALGLGCCLFLPFGTSRLPVWLPVIVADVLVLGISVGANGVVNSLMMSLEDSSDIQATANNVLIRSLAPFSRGPAGPASRFVLSNSLFGGQMAYAVMQIATSVFCVVCYHTLFHSNMMEFHAHTEPSADA